MKAIIDDILNYSASLGPIESIKIEGTDTNIIVSAADESKNLILNGTINVAEPQMKGIFGLSKLGYLKALVNFPAFKKDGSTITTEFKDTGVNGRTPVALGFKATDGSSSDYRLMHQSAIQDVANFRGGADIWDVTLDATPEIIDNFMQYANLYSSMETNFIIKQEGQDLFVLFGDEEAATHKAKMLFAANIQGTFPTMLAWNINLFIEVLKLAKNKSAKLRISSKGVLNINLTSEIGEYKYYVTGKQA